MSELVIGTRGSELATWQATFIRDALRAAHPELEIRLNVIRTTGDKILQTPLHRMADKGLFTKEIERALLDGSADLAVHSLKDLPTELPEGLSLAAVGAREDPADVLVGRDGPPPEVETLPHGASVLSGSLRRRAQLLHRRPDLRVLEIRGNIQTRIRKLQESDAAATVLAQAGLVRLGLAGDVGRRLDPSQFVPACGQGALAIEIRGDDRRLRELLKVIDHPQTRRAVAAERALLSDLGGGCQVPVGAYARDDGDETHLAVTGVVANLDGSRLLQETLRGAAGDAEAADALGRTLAETLRRRGAGEILAQVAAQSASESEKEP